MGDKLRDLFSDRPLPVSPPPADAPPPQRPASAWRWVLPVALFVLIVGAIAWISQNLPRGARPKAEPPPPENNRAADLKFLRTRAVWDPKDPDALREYEPGVPGHYDFPFLNPTDRVITLGFGRTSCDCSKLEVAVVGPERAARFEADLAKDPFPSDRDWTWISLPQDDFQGIDIPAKAGGVARINWNGRKGAGTPLRLSIRMWMQPPGKPDERSFESLEVPIMMAEPVRFYPGKLSFGPIGFGGEVQDDIYVYSTTRHRLDFKVDPKQLDPLFQVTASEPLDAAGLEALAEKLRATKVNDRIQAAIRFRVRLKEHEGGRQLDQGPFSRSLPVTSEEIEFTSPPITATVKGDVEVGVPEDGGKVIFRPFDARDGSRKTVPVYTDGAELTVESHSPPYVKVNLKPSPKESSPGRAKWLLEVVVPPGAHVGAFGEDAVVVLKIAGSRKVRVPIVGTAGQG